MSTPTITYDVVPGGDPLYGQYGYIEHTRLGYMRDGIFLGATFGWKCDGTGVGSVADFTFDQYDKEREERIPTVAFAYWIRDLLAVMGVESWEALEGKPVVTLWESKHFWGGTCKGIANPATNRVMVWDCWWAEVGKPLITTETSTA